jgi:hypothetical protein
VPPTPHPQNARLEPLVGEWSVALVMPGQERPAELPDIGARVAFEWMGEKAFLVERWTVPVPGAPDGIALIGWDEGRATFLQHYFDDRGVARVYEMVFGGGVWRLERTKADWGAFEFSQRFTGTFAAGGDEIAGTWEIAEDHRTWRKDFDLIYTRL